MKKIRFFFHRDIISRYRCVANKKFSFCSAELTHNSIIFRKWRYKGDLVIIYCDVGYECTKVIIAQSAYK